MKYLKGFSVTLGLFLGLYGLVSAISAWMDFCLTHHWGFFVAMAPISLIGFICCGVFASEFF